MKKEDLKIGAVIGFEVGGDGYVTALIYALFDGDDASIAAYVGKDCCNGASTMTLGYLRLSGEKVITYNNRDVELISPDFLDMEANDGFNDYDNLVRGILAIVQGRKSDYRIIAYEDFLDMNEEDDWIANEVGRLKIGISDVLGANDGFKKAYEEIKASRNRCPICGGRTSVKNVENERMLRERYAQLLRNEESNLSVVNGLKEKNGVLEKSNDFMEKELERLRIKYEGLRVENSDLKEENTYLKTRGFWDRLFNRF